MAAITTLILFVLTACSGADEKSSTTEAKEKYVMKIASCTTNDIMTHEMDLYKELIEEKSEGQIEVQIYPGCQLGSNQQHIQQVTNGTLQAFFTPTSFLTGLDERIALLDLPYLFPDVSAATQYVNTNGYELFEEILNPKGVTALRYYEYSPRILLLKKEINSLDDFRGQKIRTMESAVSTDGIGAWGGTGVPMGVPELYTALEQGTIDGIESGSTFFYSGKYYEQANYVLMEPQGAIVTIVMTNQKWLEELPDDLEKIVKDVAVEVTDQVNKKSKEFHEESLRKMSEEGITIIERNPKLMEEFVKASETIYEKFYERTPEVKNMVEDVKNHFGN